MEALELTLAGMDDDNLTKVHVRMQQRNGKKSWTTVAGLPTEVRDPKCDKVTQVDFKKILRSLKKTFNTNGSLVDGGEHGLVVQLQGDIRKEVAKFLIEEAALVSRDQVMIHGC
ncbi:unnamed protein product [Symbiodinium natans]|uniref:SUI1 domain-containing protein n=1 Tax=Symbiodinium natans TaxID=878477 RepID=A0A812Q239_9DINO|nr:unnamed protein product [Symbiodinium natans]